MMALSKEEALFFLRDVLEVPESVLSSQQPSVSFLNEILKSFRNAIPFQNVTAWALPQSERHLPTWEEIKERQFAKEGGMCYENNVFMKELLNALNFDARYISCHFFEPDDHISIIVYGLSEPSSRLWLDVGVVLPLLQAIPFNFEKDSGEHEIGFLHYKFVKTANGDVEWHYSRHYPHLDDCVEKGFQWCKLAVLMVDTPCNMDAIKFQMTSAYTHLQDRTFFQVVRAVVYVRDKLIAFKGKQLVMETNDKGLEKKEIDNIEDVIKAYKTYFPQIPIDVVRKALNYTILE